jgi:hypothetical protein
MQKNRSSSTPLVGAAAHPELEPKHVHGEHPACVGHGAAAGGVAPREAPGQWPSRHGRHPTEFFAFWPFFRKKITFGP